MPTTQTRRPTPTVRSDECFGQMDLGTVRRFVVACGAAGLPDTAPVRLYTHSDNMRQLLAGDAE